MLLQETLQHAACIIFEDEFSNIYKDLSSQTKEHEQRAKEEGSERDLEWVNDKKAMDLQQSNQKQDLKKIALLAPLSFFVISSGLTTFLFPPFLHFHLNLLLGDVEKIYLLQG